ncbi:cytochrome c-type biogenesis protein CcmH [Faunimonas pinastri]|uniref:Cytochrome c-type biogenesis protein n=1 Tax=Faunimonas pinastri TaxID=1855383 RepID=A0A1H9KZY0_9HYPH|nr:cytochrome c-type biogenesis protein CcmH [Faunimonas pinastri]
MLALALLCAVAAPAFAVQPNEMLPDPALEARARAISEGLRCLVCQNESIDDSNAPLAHDLRMLVRDRLKAGDTDAQVRQYLVARYGEFVLLKPSFSPENLLLWGTPIMVLAVGGLILLSRRPRRQPRTLALSAEEEAALERILSREDQPG